MKVKKTLKLKKKLIKGERFQNSIHNFVLNLDGSPPVIKFESIKY